jgi:hypothetical protein
MSSPEGGDAEASMARFMDVHTGVKHLTPEKVAEAHRRDLALQEFDGVEFLRAWADPSSGRIFCLSEGPSREAVLHVHELAGHPASEIYEVPIEIQ